MAQPSIKQQILDDFDRLSPELQRRAQELVHGLVVSASRPAGTPGKELLRFAGILDEDAAREMERTIEEGWRGGRAAPGRLGGWQGDRGPALASLRAVLRTCTPTGLASSPGSNPYTR